MAMFPIFMIGLIVGGIVGYTYSIYKKETPSETKLHIQEAEILSLKEDIKLLERENNKLAKELSEKKSK